MSYWGANVKDSDYVVQAKIHGPDISPEPDELIEFMSHQVKATDIPEEHMAQFFAEKIAAAYQDHPDAVYVTVDVLFTNGRSYGHTVEIFVPDEGE
jgi:hypothetical protein